MAELIRQWSTDHPEFQFLPRKFKIAVTGRPNDRAVTKAHDIGLRMVRSSDGMPGFEVIVGGGLGRTPMLGKVIREFLPEADLLPYLEAIVVGLQPAWAGATTSTRRASRSPSSRTGWTRSATRSRRALPRCAATSPASIRTRLPGSRRSSRRPAFESAPTGPYDALRATDPAFRAWTDTNLTTHRAPGHAIVTVSLKAHGATPGDATSAQMRVLADLAERYGHDELRISHEQNVVLPHVHQVRPAGGLRARCSRPGLPPPMSA